MIGLVFTCMFLSITKTVLAITLISVKYNVTNTRYGENLFRCARTVMSITYVAARRRTRRYAPCEVLQFSWLEKAPMDDHHSYLTKTCVSHSLSEKVIIYICLWNGMFYLSLNYISFTFSEISWRLVIYSDLSSKILYNISVTRTWCVYKCTFSYK